MARSPVISRSWTAALAEDARFYYGDHCGIDAEHGNVRYTSNKRCIVCDRAKYRLRMRTIRSAERVLKDEGKILAFDPNDLVRRHPYCYTFVAFTLGDTAGLQRWVASQMRKLSPQTA